MAFRIDNNHEEHILVSMHFSDLKTQIQIWKNFEI